MALFGAPRKLPNIDARAMGILPGDRPDWDMGDFPMGGPAQPQRRPGLGTRVLGKGWEGKVAALGGLLQGDPNAVSNYHEQQRLPLLEQAQREAEFADFQRRHQWEWANKPPSPNDTERDYEFWRQRLSPQDFETWKRNRVDPPQYRQGPDGQFYRVQTAQPPTAPVGRLTPIDGGPGGSPSGAGFR